MGRSFYVTLMVAVKRYAFNGSNLAFIQEQFAETAERITNLEEAMLYRSLETIQNEKTGKYAQRWIKSKAGERSWRSQLTETGTLQVHRKCVALNGEIQQARPATDH